MYVLVSVAKGLLYGHDLGAEWLEMFSLLNSELYQVTTLKPLPKGRFSDTSTKM